MSSRGRAVYRTLDTATDRQTAIKTYVHANGTHSHALVDEYTRLRALDHQNIVRVFELFRNEEGVARAFSMEWLEGLSPIQWVWRDLSEDDQHGIPDLQTLDFDEGLLSEARPLYGSDTATRGSSSAYDLDVHRLSARGRERFELLASQLFDALAYLREVDVIHGDIKHSNLRVEDGGRLVLFDFGAIPLRAEELAAYQFTPDYAAIEVLHGALPSFRSEVFSAAVVLFETATRRRFCSSSRKSFHFRLRELRRSGVDIPLARAIATCLSSEPASRPLATELQRWFAGRRLRLVDTSRREPLTGQNTQQPSMRQHVAQSLFDRLRQSARELVVLTGEPGSAKTTVAAHIASAWTLEPRSFVIWIGGESPTHDSYHSLRELVQGLEDACRAINTPELSIAWQDAQRDPVFRALLRRRYAYDTDPLTLQLASDMQLQLRVLDRIERLFALISDSNDLLIVFDDLQWLDADSYSAFRKMMGHAQSPPRIRFLLTTRLSPPHGRLDRIVASAGRPVYTHHLAPLSLHEQSLLVEEILGEAPSEELVTALDEGFGGHAQILAWVSHWLVDEKRVDRPPPTLHEIVWAKMNALPLQDRRLVELLTLANHPLPTRVLAHFADTPLLESLSKLEAVGLVAPLSHRRPDEYSLSHAGLREAVRAEISEETEQELLTLLAPVVAEEMPNAGEFIGRLWVHLGDEDEGLRWLLRAAHDAQRQLAFLKAAELYREVLARAPDSLRPALHLHLSEAYDQLGELSLAAEHLIEASRHLEAGRSIDLRTQATELLFTGGGEAKARATLDGLLEELSCDPYPGAAKLGVSLLSQHGVFRRYLEKHDVSTLTEQLSASDIWHLRRIKIYHVAATALAQRNFAEALFYHQKSVMLTLRGAPVPLIRSVLGLELVFVSLPGPPLRAHMVTLQTAFNALNDERFSLTAIARMNFHQISATAAIGGGRILEAGDHFVRTLTIYFDEYGRPSQEALAAAYSLGSTHPRELRFAEARALTDRLLKQFNLKADAQVFALFDLGLRSSLALIAGDLARVDALLETHRELNSTRSLHWGTFLWLGKSFERGLYVGDSVTALRAHARRALSLAAGSLPFSHYLSVELFFILGRALLDARLSSSSRRERLEWRGMLEVVLRALGRFDTPQATQSLVVLQITAALQDGRYSEAVERSRVLRRICRDGSGVALLIAVEHALAEHRMGDGLSEESKELLATQGVVDPDRYLRSLVPSRM